MKIFLLGFMGNGKTTVGKQLAEQIDYPFIDLDHEIENDEGITVEEIFFQHGEQYFRQKEREQLQKVCKLHNAVIAVGGGTPCYFDNMEVMNRAGVTVYLKLSANDIIDRLLSLSAEEVKARPLIANKSKDELSSFVHEALKKREPYYSMAKIIVENHHNQPEKTVEIIRMQLLQAGIA